MPLHPGSELLLLKDGIVDTCFRVDGHDSKLKYPNFNTVVYLVYTNE